MMRSNFSTWACVGASKVELGRSASISNLSSRALERNLILSDRPRGIVRIRTSLCHQADQGSVEQTKDDDADSAISVDGSIQNTTPPPEPSKQVNEKDSEKERHKFHVRRPMMLKRSANLNCSNGGKNKLNSGNDNRAQLSMSCGNGAVSTSKFRKAMKTFKATHLGGPNWTDIGAPHVQYFLASLCDHPVSGSATENGTESDSISDGLPARCPLATEVQKVVSKLRSAEPVNAQGYQLSVAVTVLKEFLKGIPGGIFGELTDEFYQISLQSSLELTIVYLNSILHEMPYVVQQFTYLLCKALRNLIRLIGGSSIRNYTDLLMHFTPVLFSSSLGDVNKFLRAARLLLVMVDDCERVFLPLPWLDCTGNWCWHNGDFEDETFFRHIFDSLQNLEARLATDDSGVESEPDESISSSTSTYLNNDGPIRRSMSTCSIADFYQVVYLEDTE